MIFDEYIKIFEEILELTEKIEALCVKSRSDETDELFHKRNALVKKLSVPEDLDDEKFAQIVKIKDKIAKKNENILKAMQKEKENIEKDLKDMRQNLQQSNVGDINNAEQIQRQKNNPGDSSIFS